jgi:hypothetical protein
MQINFKDIFRHGNIKEPQLAQVCALGLPSLRLDLLLRISLPDV